VGEVFLLQQMADVAPSREGVDLNRRGRRRQVIGWLPVAAYEFGRRLVLPGERRVAAVAIREAAVA
jgi:hypothetical protein